MFFNPIEYHIKRSLAGNFFILPNSNFKKVSQSFPNSMFNKYNEIFKLGNHYTGEFNCKIGNKEFKSEKMLSYDSNLKIFKNNSIFLSEIFSLSPKSMRYRDPPQVNHRMLMNNKIVTLDDIPKDIYDLLLKKSDRDILKFYTN